MRRPQGCTNHLLPREVAVGFAYDPRQRTPVGTPRVPPALAEQQPCGRSTKKRLSAAYAAHTAGQRLQAGRVRAEAGTRSTLPSIGQKKVWGTRGWEQLISMDKFLIIFINLYLRPSKATALDTFFNKDYGTIVIVSSFCPMCYCRGN